MESQIKLFVRMPVADGSLGLTGSQQMLWMALRRLADISTDLLTVYPERVSALAGCSRANVARMLAVLEETGLVEYVRAPQKRHTTVVRVLPVQDSEAFVQVPYGALWAEDGSVRLSGAGTRSLLALLASAPFRGSVLRVAAHRESIAARAALHPRQYARGLQELAQCEWLTGKVRWDMSRGDVQQAPTEWSINWDDVTPYIKSCIHENQIIKSYTHHSSNNTRTIHHFVHSSSVLSSSILSSQEHAQVDEVSTPLVPLAKKEEEININKKKTQTTSGTPLLDYFVTCLFEDFKSSLEAQLTSKSRGQLEERLQELRTAGWTCAETSNFINSKTVGAQISSPVGWLLTRGLPRIGNWDDTFAARKVSLSNDTEDYAETARLGFAGYAL